MLMGVLQRFFQDVVVPELKQIRAENAEIKTILQLTNKRLDDINVHLADQSRRIDETNKRIDAVHVDLIHRIDETNKRIDAVHVDLSHRIDETNKRIDAIHVDVIHRIDEANDRLNRLYEVIVRRDEHEGLAQRDHKRRSLRSPFTAATQLISRCFVLGAGCVFARMSRRSDAGALAMSEKD